MKMIDQILLHDLIEYNGSLSQLKEKINTEKKKFNYEWISNNEIKFLSNFSIGTLTMKGFPGAIEGIKIFGFLSETKNGKSQIKLKTKLRIELVFTTIIPILAIIAAYFNNQHIPIWSFLLIPIIFLWFWIVYRFQEKILLKTIKNFLHS